jgi:hypothetical protein
MKHRRKKVSMKEQLEEALVEISGEPVEASGLEDEDPQEGFRGVSLLPSTFLRGLPTKPVKQAQ